VNCKQGDMAEIISCMYPQNVGVIVTVKKFVGQIEGFDDIWDCLPAWPMVTHDAGTGRQVMLWEPSDGLVYIRDANLRPIRPEADPVTTDCDVGVEA